MPPEFDQVEVTLLGPGYGECVVIHLGGGHWIVVDSCIDSSTKEPAALSYLEGLGIEPERAVRLVLATHWHDDHIAGMGDLVARCNEAKFCCSSALGAQEFTALVRKFEAGGQIARGSGLQEINRVFGILIERDQPATPAGPNCCILRLRPVDTGHGKESCVWTLSPSAKQYQKFLFELAALMPNLQETKYRCPSQAPNHLSVVTWIEIGELAILLGADLEETNEEGTGWSVIVGSDERPPGQASIFKVPHHGSSNAHNDDVWREMLLEKPFAILAPWSLAGRHLPLPDDVDRLVEYTPDAYSTARLRLPRVRTRPAPVEKTLRAEGIKIRRAEPPTGAVQLRNGGTSDPLTWEKKLFREACHLSEVHAES